MYPYFWWITRNNATPGFKENGVRQPNGPRATPNGPGAASSPNRSNVCWSQRKFECQYVAGSPPAAVAVRGVLAESEAQLYFVIIMRRLPAYSAVFYGVYMLHYMRYRACLHVALGRATAAPFVCSGLANAAQTPSRASFK